MIENSIEQRSVQFAHAHPKSFSRELRRRVNLYFKENNLSKKGDSKMLLKTAGMLSIYFLPYIAMLTLQPSVWLTLSLFFIMGIGMSGIGMGVMHDAVHGAYHEKGWVNKILGATIYLISGNVTTWRLQHNVLHHTYTNIEGLDDDLETSGLIRLHPNQPWKKMHKNQAWYAPLLYGLLTLNWVVMKDFKQLLRYQKTGLANFSNQELRNEWINLILTKALYFSLFIVLPLIFVPVAWYFVILGFVLMHFTAGFLLSFVFQLAHVVDHVETFDMPVSGKMDDAWMEHQLRTTSNFARKSKLVSWFVGGLNFQIEHHLFPNICHVHYPAMSKIVRETAAEFNLPYNEHIRLGEAIQAHMNSLRQYGMKPVPLQAN